MEDQSSAPREEIEENSQPHRADEATPVELFIRGLTGRTTHAKFLEYFDKYGDVTKIELMTDGGSGKYGFITFANPFVADKVIEDTHIINGKQVIVKRTREGMDILVRRIPETMTEDEFRDIFKQYGEVEKYIIMQNPITKCSRGFGFISFASEEIAEQLLAKPKKIRFRNTVLKIKRAKSKTPKAQTERPPPSSYGSGNNGIGGYGRGYGGVYGGHASGNGCAHVGHASGYGGPYIGFASGYGGPYGGFGDGYGSPYGGTGSGYGGPYGGFGGGYGGPYGGFGSGYGGLYGGYGSGYSGPYGGCGITCGGAYGGYGSGYGGGTGAHGSSHYINTYPSGHGYGSFYVGGASYIPNPSGG